jgi:hypothetical protein
MKALEFKQTTFSGKCSNVVGISVTVAISVAFTTQEVPVRTDSTRSAVAIYSGRK